MSRLAARQDRAALIAVELRHARGNAGAADRDRPLRLVNGVGETLVPAEIAERRDVLGEDLVGGALRDAADHPQPGADVMRADRGARFEAVVRVLRGGRDDRGDTSRAMVSNGRFMDGLRSGTE